MTASGSVGTSSTSRLSVDLVLSSGATDLNITAGTDVFLDLTGLLRERCRLTPDRFFLGGTIQTPGQINIMLENTVQDTRQRHAGSVSLPVSCSSTAVSATPFSGNAPLLIHTSSRTTHRPHW